MKRIFCLILAMLVLLPTLFACKNDEGSTQTGEQEVQSSEDQESNDLLDTIPTGSYSKKEFLIAVPERNKDEVCSDSLSGEFVNDTVYKWYEKINLRYDVSIRGEARSNTEFFDKQKNEIDAGQGTVHLYGCTLISVATPIRAKLYKNWNTMGNMINLNTDRWDRNINEKLTWMDKLYVLSGDLGYSKIDNTMVTYYNKEIMSDLGYSTADLLKMVDEKDWTFEAFEKMIKNTYLDADKDKKKGDGDVYGYVAQSLSSHDVWLTQFGIDSIALDESDTIVSTLRTPEMVSLVGKLWKFLHKNEGVLSSNDISITKTEYDFFADDQAAMITGTLSSAERFAEELGTNSFGILPAPLLDKNQNDYCTKLTSNYLTWGVSKATPEADIDFVAHITDALCAESSQTLYPAFYNHILKEKYSKDEDMARMIDLIMQKATVDRTAIFSAEITQYITSVRNTLDKSAFSEGEFLSELGSGKLQNANNLYTFGYKRNQ
ncbi:MAG: hypothetical protein IJY47_06975 [Clostridia bacterium]|nr:hypothetical protein [Clostridia bacterium]